MPLAQIRKVNTFQFTAPGCKVVVPTSETSPQQWEYTTNMPVDGLPAKHLDDSSWLKGGGAFGAGDHVGTRWTTLVRDRLS